MRFLFECVSSCYRADPTCPDSAVDPPLAPVDDQARSLFSPASPSNLSSPSDDSGSLHVRRKKRQVSRSAKAGGDWKPSLHAISEDNASNLAAKAAMAKTKANAERDRKVVVNNNSRKSGGGSKRCGVSRQRGRSDYYGHETLPIIVPAIAPTPFMF